MRRVLVTCCALLCVTPVTAQAVTFTVDPRRGFDRAPGTATRPLRTVTAACERIPAGRSLAVPVTIRLRAGRYVLITGNVVDQPRRQGDRLFTVAEPYAGAAQEDSGVGVATTTDLRVVGNRFAGRGLPDGLPARADGGANELAATPGLFRSPGVGRRLVPLAPMPPAASAAFPRDAPTAAED